MSFFADDRALQVQATDSTEATRKAVQKLAEQTYQKVVELATERLRSRLPAYLEALRLEPNGEDGWRIVLAANARWIDDGMPSRDMLQDLLASPKAKVSKSGHRYIVIPMGGKRRATPQANLGATIRTAMSGAAQNRLDKAAGPVQFRVASEKQQGKWRHPGLPGAHIFEAVERLSELDAEKAFMDELVKGMVG